MMLYAVLLFTLLPMTIALNAYVLVFPKTIRPGMRFDCLVTRESTAPHCNLTASITVDSKPIVSGQFDIVEKNQVISLQVPDRINTSSHYFTVLAVDKHGKEKLSNKYYLNRNNKRLSMFIQTDKAIYKPGQTVQFRVLVVNAELDLLKETMDIDIFDPARNRISLWRNVSAPSGVFQGEMVMSTEPPLGVWVIEVVYAGKDKITKQFTVEEFVLPKFEVSLSTSSVGVLTDEYLSGTVTVKYTFGKGVEGNGTLIIKKKYLGFREEERKYSLSFKMKGTYKFQIDTAELFTVLGVTTATTLVLDVNVTETLTGNTMSDSAEVQYFTRLEKLVFLSGANNFKPGLRYKTYVLLSDQKNRPLAVDDAKIDFSISLSTDDNPDVNGRIIYKTSIVGKNGIAKISLKVPMDTMTMIITASYGDLVTRKTVYQFHSLSDSYVQVELLTRRPKAGKNATFRITSTKPRKQVDYMIVGRGEILLTGRVYMESKRVRISVPLIAEMAPSPRLFVYYLKPNSEIVADSIKFSLEGIFDNKVTVRFRRKTIEPGKNVSLVVKADPGSQCNVLVVDKSVLLLKKGNDITPAMVEEEVVKYDNIPPAYCSISPCIEQYFSAPIPGSDVPSLIYGSGLAVITNAFLYRYRASTLPESSSSSSSSATFYYVFSSTLPLPTSATSFFSSASTVFSETSSTLWSEVSEEEAEKEEIQEPPPRIRSLFPDTWIYSNTETANSNGKCFIKATVPDTITSWVATAFAVHNESGLGIAPKPANLEVFLKFFIRLELPYSVIRGEQLVLQASVFNFFDTDIEVDVLLRRSECYENILVTQADNGSTVLEFTQQDISREITIPADDAVTLNFPIKPIELGNCEIDIQAIGPGASDAVKRDLLVKAEGIEENYNIAIMIEIREGQNFYSEQPITLPDDVVDDSAKIRISVVGDLMGPSITGLTKLLGMPYGCGEQNMMSMVPNIFVIKYLTATLNIQPEDLSNGRRYMAIGYQRQLNYRHLDGSFSAFGSRDASGSTWLTAFVLKSFSQARPYIYIDPNIMQKMSSWILRQFDKDRGVFKEPGRVHHRSMQGGSVSGEGTLATYVIIALLEAENAGFAPGDDVKDVINDAVEALEARVDNVTDIYELGIAAYALQLAGSDKVDDVLAKLDETAIEEGGMKYWKAQAERDSSTLFWRRPIPRNVEVNSYILMTYVARKDPDNSLLVMKWLVKQRNSLGGYGSTQDTVLGLQALSEVAAYVFSPSHDIQIIVTSEPGGSVDIFYVNRENALLFQTAFIPETITLIKINASGTGIALLQISVTYNVMEDPIEPLFTMTITYTNETVDGFGLRICFRWLGEDVSSMAVMEIGLLSGFTGDRFSVTSIGILKKVEDGDNMRVLYFDEIPVETVCIDVQMARTGLVAGIQPAIVKLYDYYDPQNHVISYYQPELLRDTDVCDIAGREIGCNA